MSAISVMPRLSREAFVQQSKCYLKQLCILGRKLLLQIKVHVQLKEIIVQQRSSSGVSISARSRIESYACEILLRRSNIVFDLFCIQFIFVILDHVQYSNTLPELLYGSQLF